MVSRGLAKSIESHGLQQPITVIAKADGRYELIAGERRLIACRSLGWATIPAIIRDGDQAILALVENVQRENLSPIEEAEAFAELLERGETQQSIADKVGVTRSYVAQKVRLLELPAEARRLLLGETASIHGPISEGAARQLLRLNLLRKIGTAEDVDYWVDRYCHTILWDDAAARTVADVQFYVDYYMVLLSMSVDTYAGPDGWEKAKAMFAAACERIKSRTGPRRLLLWESEALLYAQIRPEGSRLSDVQWKELDEANWRWAGEHERRYPSPDPGDELAGEE